MRKTILIISFITVLLVLIYVYYINSIDTRYAINFSKTFMNYDIQEIDKYLSNETIIICNGKKDTYENLRANVILACNEKKYLFEKDSSYGYGDNKFINGIQHININLYGKLNGRDMGECNIAMKLKRNGILNFMVDSLACDEQIFEYLFYGTQSEF